jgi:hypothetical protein
VFFSFDIKLAAEDKTFCGLVYEQFGVKSGCAEVHRRSAFSTFATLIFLTRDPPSTSIHFQFVKRKPVRFRDFPAFTKPPRNEFRAPVHQFESFFIGKRGGMRIVSTTF